MKYKRVKIGRKRSRIFLICRRSFVVILKIWVHKICNFLIYPSLFLFPFMLCVLLSRFHQESSRRQILLSLFFLSLSFFHFPLLKSSTTGKYNICRKCISRFIIIFMRAIVIGLKVQLFKYDVNLYILSCKIVIVLVTIFYWIFNILYK